MIQVRDLCFQHDTHHPAVIEGLCLDVDEHDKVAVRGPSGVGKTTLVYLLAGLLPPTKGDVAINGFRFGEHTERELTRFRNQCVGVIFQEYNLMAQLTVAENLMLRLAIAGRKRARHELVESLDRVGMADYVDRRVHSLSGGQQQRVALVRALITEPEIVLADEPTGNLDDRSAEFIVNVLMGENQRTVLIVSHDARLLDQADKQYGFLELCGRPNASID